MLVLGIVLGSLLGLCVLGGAIYLTIRYALGNSNLKIIHDLIKNGEFESEENAYARDKSIGGMTSIYEPQIRADFPDFNLSMLFESVERNIRAILNAKTKKDTSLLDSKQLLLIRGNVLKEIEDLNLNEITVSYKDISFSRHVIKHYSKENGTATITTASQVKYYYDSNKKDEKYNHVKKSTVYICNFIYVYDESKFKKEQKAFSINCPNCGAPVKGLDGGNCDYCGSLVKPINMKAWQMISYKEDKRN